MTQCRRPDCGKELSKACNVQWCPDDPICQAHRRQWKIDYQRQKAEEYRKARSKGPRGGFREKPKVKEVEYSSKWACIYKFCPKRGDDGKPEPLTIEEVKAGHRFFHKECHSIVSDQCADYGTAI